MTWIDNPFLTPPPPEPLPADAPETMQIVLQTRAEAEEANWSRCVQGEVIFYVPCTRALVPGHIYSPDGIAEWKMSKCCEYHFDLWFKEVES